MAAIAYKSAGAGAGLNATTALAPACPAVVDANDILIMHVVYRGTAIAPSTPAGWTLLDGPRDIGTTVAARAWVYGKIAAGTEDGATVSLGTTASAIEKVARIYSFSGWASGTITDVVPAASFSGTTHATDPAMPTVTTTAANSRAIALVTQADNNALAAATGATNGTWTEAVAEYTVALTTGFVIQLQTVVPTTNPGTVSGGAVAATNDPSGVTGFEIRDQPPPVAAIGLDQATMTFEGTAA